MSLLAGCATANHYDCPAPVLTPWTKTQQLELAREIERAQKEGRWEMMLRAILDYHRMRREIRACGGGE